MNTEVESGTVEPTVAETQGAPAAAAPQKQAAQQTNDNHNDSNGNAAAATAVSDNPLSTWEELGVKPALIATLLEMGFTMPMPVQRAVFSRMMAGKDVLVQSRTGSGKTAAFGIPFAQGLIDGDKKQVQALCLAPTRELALQVGQECEKIAADKLHVIPVYGGAPMGKQIEQLKAGAQVVAGTPGRVLDHLRRGTLNLDGLKILVLDEADEMLSMGFLEEITEIIKRCPTDRQTVLFSATIPDDIERIGSRYMRNPEKIALSTGNVGVQEITHTYYMVSGMGRAKDLVRVLDQEKPESAIIFCNTREDTSLVAEFLRKSGMDAEAISSDLTQKDRERVMGRMKDKNLHYLVATDIAARGIDISNLSHVINYTFPESAEVYVHRTGRTGRAGKSGMAISLISPRELGNFYMLKLTYKIKPEERTLPSDEQYKTAKEALKVDELKAKLGTRQPDASWRQLAKRVWASDEGERLVAILIEDKLSGHATASSSSSSSSASSLPNERPRSQAPRAASPALEPIPSAGPTGGFSSPPPAQREKPRDKPADRAPLPARAAAAPAIAKEAAGKEVAEAAPGAAAKDKEGSSDGEKRERKRRTRRGGRGGERERRDPAGDARPPRRNAETIDNSDGKEFWEAWVDSKSEPAASNDGDKPATAAAEPRADKSDKPERGERNGRSGRGAERERENEAPLPEGHVRLYLNLGRRDSAKEPEIEKLIADHSLDVQSFQVRNSHTYLIMLDERADAAIAALSGHKFGERDIVCERARK